MSGRPTAPCRRGDIMAYDIRLMKLVTGEMVIGKYDAEKDCLNEVASLQSIPTQQGMQMMLPRRTKVLFRIFLFTSI